MVRMSKQKKLGEGSFGCVLSRPLRCSGKETKISDKVGPNQVAKIFYKKDSYETEVNLGKMVKKIDSSEKNILVPIGACPVAAEILQKPENREVLTRCEVLSSSSISSLQQSSQPKFLWQIKMPYAGQEIDLYLEKKKKPIPVGEFAKMMLPVFRAVALLEEHKMVHQDIKVNNVLVHRNKAILIDFSLMMPFGKIYMPSNYPRLKRKYRPYPPEYYMAAVRMHYKDLLSKSSPEYASGFLALHYNRRLEAMQYYFYPYYMLAEIQAMSNHEFFQKLPLKDYVQFAHKVDVFSLGTLCASLHRQLENPMNHPEYMQLMRGLLHPDPRKRFGPREALALCEKIAA